MVGFLILAIGVGFDKYEERLLSEAME